MKRDLEICGVEYVAYFTANPSTRHDDAISFDFHVDGTGKIMTSMDGNIPETLQESMLRLIEQNLTELSGAKFCYIVQKRVH